MTDAGEYFECPDDTGDVKRKKKAPHVCALCEGCCGSLSLGLLRDFIIHQALSLRDASRLGPAREPLWRSLCGDTVLTTVFAVLFLFYNVQHEAREERSERPGSAADGRARPGL